jgi:hypothetical protein
MSGARDGAGARPMTDERVERELRLIHHRRHPGPAPMTLRERVLDVPKADQGHGGRRGAAALARPLMAMAASVAVLVAGASIVALLAGRTLQGPAASPIPSQPAGMFDPTLTGPGIVPTPGLAPMHAVAILLFALLLLGAVAVGRRAGWVLAVPALLLPLVGLGLANVPGPAQGSLSAPGVSTERAAMPAGYEGPDLVYVLAGPGAPYSLGFSLRNDGPLPIRIEGIVEPDQEGALVPSSSAVWLDGSPWPGSTGPAQPFTPVDVPPSEEVMLWLVRRASPCAIGPGWDGTDTGGYAVSQVTVSFSVLGWPRTTDVELPFEVYEPITEPCPAQG